MNEEIYLVEKQNFMQKNQHVERHCYKKKIVGSERKDVLCGETEGMGDEI